MPELLLYIQDQDRRMAIEVPCSATAQELLDEVAKQLGRVPQLTFAGEPLGDGPLADLGVCPESTLHTNAQCIWDRWAFKHSLSGLEYAAKLGIETALPGPTELAVTKNQGSYGTAWLEPFLEEGRPCTVCIMILLNKKSGGDTNYFEIGVGNADCMPTCNIFDCSTTGTAKSFTFDILDRHQSVLEAHFELTTVDGDKCVEMTAGWRGESATSKTAITPWENVAVAVDIAWQAACPTTAVVLAH
eukprot:TRINITY_DN9033_c0_g1_i1.p1 TRINITY_DN9033_c0_g1~~TRINITY_DN9033_c0_g1_i1.p1  ORF type:complete len:274 (+),score=34.68 TRINITY_DN9033_c0_g1_i1:88-822(+)